MSPHSAMLLWLFCGSNGSYQPSSTQQRIMQLMYFAQLWSHSQPTTLCQTIPTHKGDQPFQQAHPWQSTYRLCFMFMASPLKLLPSSRILATRGHLTPPSLPQGQPIMATTSTVQCTLFSSCTLPLSGTQGNCPVSSACLSTPGSQPPEVIKIPETVGETTGRLHSMFSPHL